jgi:hypothetical protein
VTHGAGADPTPAIGREFKLNELSGLPEQHHFSQGDIAGSNVRKKPEGLLLDPLIKAS